MWKHKKIELKVKNEGNEIKIEKNFFLHFLFGLFPIFFKLNRKKEYSYEKSKKKLLTWKHVRNF